MSVGSMNSVMFGKNYNRAINCHKAMAENLEKLLFDKCVETTCLTGIPGGLLQAKVHIINERNLENFNASM